MKAKSGRVLITGGAGFIGSNFLRYLRTKIEDVLIVVDNLSTGRLENIASLLDDPKVKFFCADLTKDIKVLDFIFNRYSPETIFHFAAEAHVDESIRNPLIASSNFLMTNILLEKARKYGVRRFIQISTDEVYGPIYEGFVDENHPLNPSSPYSASKAACDLLCLSYFKTYSLPVIITRCTNNYGPYLDVRRLIARHITNAFLGLPLPIWDGGGQIRDWLYVEDHCEALLIVMQKGRPGDIYNISAGNLKTNLEVAEAILRLIPDSKSQIVLKGSRPAHDVRYALDSSRIRSLGWEPRHSFEEGLRLTVDWFRRNEVWWREVKKKVERELYDKISR